MGVFKEEAHTFETIAQKQTQIYNDACDNGYPYKKSNPPSEITELIDAVKQLQELDKKFPEEKPMVRNRQTWGKGNNAGVSVDVVIFWEIDEGYYRGTEYAISFNNLNPNDYSLKQKGNDAFISVDIHPIKEKA